MIEMIEIGKSYYFKMESNNNLLGRVVNRENNWLELAEASWISDHGRLTKTIRDNVLTEIEPVGTACINLDLVIVYFPWIHDFPKEQKKYWTILDKISFISSDAQRNFPWT